MDPSGAHFKSSPFPPLHHTHARTHTRTAHILCRRSRPTQGCGSGCAASTWTMPSSRRSARCWVWITPSWNPMQSEQKQSACASITCLLDDHGLEELAPHARSDPSLFCDCLHAKWGKHHFAKRLPFAQWLCVGNGRASNRVTVCRRRAQL